ncbi:MAG: T9SS type A sorting domain-containing protein [Bacteroidia bacterium]|nr:T9SS type A sorting domain-containing protein [Bacteroidia bacterium]
MNKIFKPLLLTTAFLIASYSVHAQEKCATWTNMQQEMKEHPELATQYEQWQTTIDNYIKEHKGKPKNGGKRIIPVVVHVIHEYGAENISKEQIISQIDALNEDFSRTNNTYNNIPTPFKALAADCNIEFRLATKDDMGNCTDGIVRVYSPKSTDATNRSRFKDLSYWNSNKYLNIWVVKSIDAGESMQIPGTVLGYAQFPYNIFPSGLMSTDGVVLRSDHTGRIGTAMQPGRSGRTATHEVGHWLGLRHIWGDAQCGNDFVDDTPIAYGPNFGVCWDKYPYHVTGAQNCNRSALDTLGEMFMNYMDYSDDDCMAMFTHGQLEVMDATLNSFRKNLWSAANLEATGTRDEDIANASPCAPTADFSDNRAVTGRTQYQIAMICEGTSVTYKEASYGGSNNKFAWEFEGANPASSTSSQVTATYPDAGVYDVKLTVNNTTGASTMSRENYVMVSSKTADYTSGPYYEDFEQGGGFEKWISINSDGSDNKWEHNPYFGFGGGGCFRMSNFRNTYNEIDKLVSPSYNLKSVSSPVLSFKMAAAERGSRPYDQFTIFTSGNCGQTWSQKKAWSGAAMLTAGIFTADYKPGSVDEWQTFYLPLSTVANNDNLRIMFEFKAGSVGSNNIYIDEVNIGTALGTAELYEQTGFSVFPNPSNGTAVAEFFVPHAGQVNVMVYDITGNLVQQISKGKVASGEMQVQLDLSNSAAGLYTVRLDIDGKTTFRKLIVE